MIERGKEALRETRRAWPKGKERRRQAKEFQGPGESPFGGGYQIPDCEDSS